MRFFKLLLLFFVLVSAAPSYALEENIPERLVNIRILPEHGRVKPGQEMWIGIEQAIAPGWHTYWKNPGDSGVPPRIGWDLPPGFAVDDIVWPAPQKLPYGPLLNYGYSDKVVLLQKLKAPDPLPPGPFVLQAKVDVLVCKEECIPESGTYEITLNGSESEADDNEGFLRQALALVPAQTSWDASFHEEGQDFKLHLSQLGDVQNANLEAVEFYPLEWGLVENTAETRGVREDNKIVITQMRGNRALSEIENFEGVVVFKDGNQRKAYSFQAKPASKGGAVSNAAPVVQQEEKPVGFLQAIMLALFGGLILNLMPCVFPVLSIKALSLVEAVNKDPARVRLHGMSYMAGVMLSFLVLAAILIVLKGAGAEIGWGFQLQNPLVIGFLIYLFLLIGLSLLGFFEIGGRFVNFGTHFTRGEDYKHSFFTGVLATLVATPCTAPFMAAAIGYALVQPAFAALLIFAALGFGLALPYVVLSFVPAAQKLLPRPGHWMETFRQALAFPMLASAAWLCWVLVQQAGAMAILKILMGGLLLALALWAARQMTLTRVWYGIKIFVMALAVLFSLALLPWPSSPQDEKFGEAFSAEKLEASLKGDDPVFVEMTAAWCITCKFNHAAAINTESTKKVFTDHNVKYLIGDWTNADPVITEYLKKYGRSGVPIYVYYGPKQDGQRPPEVILPQILTPGLIEDLF